MTKIKARTDCGNSPKNLLLQNLTIAIAKGDVSRIEEFVKEDVDWEPVGRKPVSGVDAFCKSVTRYGPATKLVVDQVISHGRSGAVNGVVEFGEKRRAFCYIFEFSNAKGTEVKTIKSFSVPISSGR